MGGRGVVGKEEVGYGFSIPIVATEEEGSGLWSFEWKEGDSDEVEQEDEIDTQLCSFPPPLVCFFLHLCVCVFCVESSNSVALQLTCCLK